MTSIVYNLSLLSAISTNIKTPPALVNKKEKSSNSIDKKVKGFKEYLADAELRLV